MRRRIEGGYAGLIALMVTALLVALLFVRFYLTPREDAAMAEVQPTSASGTVPSTEIGKMRADIDAANALKEKLDADNRAVNAALGE